MAENPHRSDQPGPLATETDTFSDTELSELRTRLDQDPAAARAFALMQKRGLAVLRRLVDETVAKLAAMEQPQETENAGTDWKRLSGLARSRELAARERRELAQSLVMGALVNVDNPGWDPLDPSTSEAAASSSVLALLDLSFATPQNNGAR